MRLPFPDPSQMIMPLLSEMSTTNRIQDCIEDFTGVEN